LDVDNSPLDSNAWFSGFVDADGSFGVNVRDGGAGRVDASLRVEQRQNDPVTNDSYFGILASIADAFMGSLGTRVQT